MLFPMTSQRSPQYSKPLNWYFFGEGCTYEKHKYLLLSIAHSINKCKFNWKNLTLIYFHTFLLATIFLLTSSHPNPLASFKALETPYVVFKVLKRNFILSRVMSRLISWLKWVIASFQTSLENVSSSVLPSLMNSTKILSKHLLCAGSHKK